MLIRTKDAAARLEITPLTLRKWVHAGWGPPVLRTPTGAWRFDEEDLSRWVQSRKAFNRGAEATG